MSLLRRGEFILQVATLYTYKIVSEEMTQLVRLWNDKGACQIVWWNRRVHPQFPLCFMVNQCDGAQSYCRHDDAKSLPGYWKTSDCRRLARITKLLVIRQVITLKCLSSSEHKTHSLNSPQSPNCLALSQIYFMYLENNIP